MSEIPGGEGGFELGRAFVSVVPDASDFVAALDEEIGGLSVTVKVTPDASDFAAALDEAIGGLSATVVVTPDASNFADALDEQLGGLSATVTVVPDMSEFDDAIDEATSGLTATVTIVPDAADFGTGVDEQSGATSVAVVPDMTIFDEQVAEETAGLTVDAIVVPDASDFADALDEQVGGLTITARVMPDLTELAEAAGLAGTAMPVSVPVVPDKDSLANFGAAVEEEADGITVGVNVVPSPSSLANFEPRIDDAVGGIEVPVAAVPDMSDFAERAQAQADSMAVTLKVNPEMEGDLLGGADTGAAASGLQDVTDEANDLTEAATRAAQAESSMGTEAAEAADEVGTLGASMSSSSEVVGAVAAEWSQFGVTVSGAASMADEAIDELNATYTANLDASQQAVEAAAGVQEAAASEAAELAELQEAYASLSATADSLGADVAALDERFTAVASGVEEYDSSIASMTADMETLYSHLEQIEQGFQLVDSAIDSGSATIDELEQAYGLLSSSISAVRSEFSAVSSAVSESIAPMENMQALAQQLGTSIDELPAKWEAMDAALGSSMDAGAASVEKLNSSMSSIGSETEDASKGVDDLATSSEGLISRLSYMATDPFAWVMVATVAIPPLISAVESLSDSGESLVSTLTKQDDAVGYNVSGYQELSAQLAAASSAQEKMQQQVDSMSNVGGHATGVIDEMNQSVTQLTQAQQQAQTEAQNLGNNLTTLEQTYGLTQEQAEALATAAGVSAKQLTGSGTSANDAMAKIEAYANANESAQGSVGQLSNDMSTFSNNALTATSRVTALDDAFNLLVGNFVSMQQAQLSVSQDFLTISSNAQQAGASMTGTNTASVQLQQSFYSTVTAIEQAANAMVKQGDSTQQVNTYLDQQTSKLQALTGGNQQAEQAVEGLKQWEDQLKSSTDNLDTSITKAAQDVENQYTAQIEQAGVQSGTAKTDVQNLTTAIQDNGTQSTNYSSARQQLIKDLENAGLSAQAATTLVDNLTKSIQQIPSTKDVTIDVNGQGQWTVHEEAGVTVPTAMSGTTAHLATTGAGGGVIPGFSPGHDIVPAMLSPGEGVLVPEAVAALGEDTVHQLNAMYSGGGRPSTGALKRYAQGGVVGGNSIAGMPTWISSNYSNTVTVGENLVLADILQAEGFADGGIVQIPAYATGGVVWDAAAAGVAAGHQMANMSAIDTSVLQGEMINGASMPYAAAGAERAVTVNFNGMTQFPNPEQIQAIQLALSAAVGVS